MTIKVLEHERHTGTESAHSDMTYISNDPALWPLVNWIQIFGYFVVASFAAVVYDWALTFGQEFELVWRHHWSLMTVLYVCVRYIGISSSVVYMLAYIQVPITDVGCTIFWFVQARTPIVINAMLGVVMMTRIYAMYHGSKKMLIFLLVILLTSTIASGVLTVIANLGVSGEESILSGYHICFVDISTNQIDLNSETFIPTAVWEIVAFFLAAWIVIKHIRERLHSSTGSTIGDCFIVLAQSHVLYFLSFAAVSCLDLGLLSPNILYSDSVGDDIYGGALQIVQVLQMFVLGPRLILSVREYHAKLLDRSGGGTGMTTIIFEELGHVSTTSSGGI